MNWNTNWRGNIDKVLNVVEVLNTDGVLGKEGLLKEEKSEINFDKLWSLYPKITIKHINKNGIDEFNDHCAINVSDALINSGVSLINFNGAKCYAKCPLGNNLHAIRAEELAKWISKNSKKINTSKYFELDGDNFLVSVKDKRGIIFFKDYWQRKGEDNQIRTGDHISLWDRGEMAGQSALITYLRLTWVGNILINQGYYQI